jgi:hypothetical protein
MLHAALLLYPEQNPVRAPQGDGRVKLSKKSWTMLLASMWVGHPPAAIWEKLGSSEGHWCFMSSIL